MKARRLIRAKQPTRPAAAKPRRPGIPEIDIGIRLRHARLTKGLRLRSLAGQVGCTESFLSKVENDKVQPSLAMLHRIVMALEINVATLFSEDNASAGPVAITRNGNRATIKTDPLRRGRGVVIERLVSNAVANLLEANIHHVAPKGSSDGFIEHDGEELGFVMQGTLELVVDGVTYLVQQGDSFFFRSNLAHGYRNPGVVEARVLWINTPPSF